jgi:hypothetical protein
MSEALRRLPPPLAELSKFVQSLQFSEVLPFWDEADGKGTDVPAIRQLCLSDRFYLLVKVLRRTDAWHPWIYARCREVEAAPDGFCDIWAREHYKSTIITLAGVIQEILRDQETCIGIFSHTKPIAKGFLAQIQRELEANENLKAIFPDILWVDPVRDAPAWSLDAGLIVRRSGNPKEGTIEAHGLVDGQPTSKHFNLIVYDDVVTRESVNTPEQIQKTTEAWELSDNLGVAGGRKWIIGTRYHYADTYSEIIKRGAARARIYPATHDGTLDGEPVLFTQTEWLRRVRDQGEATVACQLLANPLAGHQRLFDQSDLREYEVRPETLMVYLMVDPARSMKKDSANTAMAVIGIDYAGNKYLLDGYDHKMDLQERWTRMRDLWETWRKETGVQGIHVGYERYGAIADLDYFKERQKVENCGFEIEELEWPREGPGSKIDRVQRLGPDLRSHRFYVPRGTDPNKLTRNQQMMLEQGYDYRISHAIRRRDEQGKAYDLTERFKLQCHFFPFGSTKDLIDAVSRIYDMTPLAPVIVDQTQLEPEYV